MVERRERDDPDITRVERLTYLSTASWLTFEPAVLLEAGDEFWVDLNARMLNIRRGDGAVHQVAARARNPESDIR